MSWLKDKTKQLTTYVKDKQEQTKNWVEDIVIPEKVKKFMQAYGETHVRPVGLMPRMHILKWLRLDYLHGAEKLYPALLPLEEIRKLGLNEAKWHKSRKQYDQVWKIYKGLYGEQKSLNQVIKLGYNHAVKNGFGIKPYGTKQYADHKLSPKTLTEKIKAFISKEKDNYPVNGLGTLGEAVEWATVVAVVGAVAGLIAAIPWDVMIQEKPKEQPKAPETPPTGGNGISQSSAGGSDLNQSAFGDEWSGMNTKSTKSKVVGGLLVLGVLVGGSYLLTRQKEDKKEPKPKPINGIKPKPKTQKKTVLKRTIDL